MNPGYQVCYSLSHYEFNRLKSVHATRLCNKRFHGDARNTDLPGSSFDHVIVMGNSLGYIQAPDADSKIIKEAYRTLRPGGWLVVDIADGNVVKNSFNPNSWHEIGEKTVIAQIISTRPQTFRLIMMQNNYKDMRLSWNLA